MTKDVKSTAALTPPHPAQLSARLDPGLSRWLWLVKWLLALPHYLLLTAFSGGLRALSVLLTLYAGIAPAFTGVYPRGIFDLVIGLNRWAHAGRRVRGPAHRHVSAVPARPTRCGAGDGLTPASQVLRFPCCTTLDAPRNPDLRCARKRFLAWPCQRKGSISCRTTSHRPGRASRS